MRVALALLVLAGCGSDPPGMRLDVRAADTGAARIELYLARAKCPQCVAIQPPNHTMKLAGTGFFLDGGAVDGTPETARSMDNGRAVFDLRAPGDADAELPVVLVVGYDAAGSIVGAAKLDDVVIPSGSTVWWKLDLAPASGASSSDKRQPAGQRIDVWRRAAPGVAACVGYESADGTHAVERTWLVPEDDTDCDEVAPALDCDKLAYHQMGTAGISSASCLTGQYTVPGAQGAACLVGGPACVDGSPSATGTCARVDPYYCVPQVVCDNPTCRTEPVTCAIAGLVTRMQCDVPVNQNGAPCADNGQPEVTTVDLSTFLATAVDASTEAVTCEDVEFASDLMRPQQLSDTISKNGLQLKRDNLATPCKFQLTYESGPSGGTASAPLAAFADMQLSNGNHILVPFVFQFHPSCSQGAFGCNPIIGQNETMQSCSIPPP